MGEKMATPTSQLDLAREIADETVPEDARGYRTRAEWQSAWLLARDAALAAIERTSEMAAGWIEGERKTHPAHGWEFASSLRSHEHLKADAMLSERERGQ